jgi:hypothetical protein
MRKSTTVYAWINSLSIPHFAVGFCSFISGNIAKGREGLEVDACYCENPKNNFEKIATAKCGIKITQ